MNLDKKDIRLISAVDKNPRIHISSLAKQIRLSQQVVHYRFKKLIENNVITHCATLVDLAKIGQRHYIILLQLANISDEEKQKILIYLQKEPHIYWAATIGGKWDILITLIVQTHADFEKFLSNIFITFQKDMRDYDAVYVIAQEFYSHKYIHQEKSEKVIFPSAKTEIRSLSNLDKKILHYIASDCRISTLQLGMLCSVSYKTIQQHIRTLEEEKIIAGYRLFLHSELLGYKAYLLLLSFQDYGLEAEKKLFGAVAETPEVTQAAKLFGRWSILLHVRAKDEITLQKKIIELRNNYPSIGSYEIIPIFADIVINTFPIS